MMMHVIITSPSLDEKQNVSGVSAVTKFIIGNNESSHYIHFELGKKDNEKRGLGNITRIFRNLVEWNKLLRKQKEAIIHYNFPLSKPSILRDPLFMLIARAYKKKMVIHVHGGNFLTAEYTPFYLKWILKRVFSMSLPVIVLSDMEKELLTQKYGCKNIQVLPNCVDLHDAKDNKKTLPEGKAPLVLGYLGRIAETKGMSELLEACVKLKQDSIPFVLRIAGKEEIPNQYLPKFRELLGDNFCYDGVVSGKSKVDFLKKLDVFVLPSYFEGLPMSLLECMSFGAVPLTTNVGSIGKVVIEPVNGIFIKDHDIDSIYTQFVFMHNNREDMRKMSVKAKETIFRDFNPELYIQKLNSIYKSIL